MTHQAPIATGTPVAFAPEIDLQPGARWTAPKMAAFLRMLSATHSVSEAARSVGMSRQSAYRLRSRLKGSPFDLAWDVAFHHSYDNLAHAALERALNGVEIPVFYKGEKIGSYRRFDERLTLALLSRSTIRRNVPLMGRHAPEAELHAARFEALVAEIEVDGDEDERAAQALARDSGPAPSGEISRIYELSAPFPSDADVMAALRAFGADEALDEEGDRV